MINGNTSGLKEYILDNLDCVKKSYPNFWEVFLLLGGKIYEYLG